MDNRPIGFFDSGIGLLSILIETKKLLPRETFVIFADQGHNPYGEKTRTQIKKYAENAIKFLIKKHKIKMIVLACNTATVLALDYLRKKFEIPIIGVVPAVKPAFKKSKASRVVIMSTPATAKSAYLENLVRFYGRGTKTLKLGCAGLEETIETLNQNGIGELVDKFAAKIKKFKADLVVLGCTHYPLVKSKIKNRLGAKVKLIDSGYAVAKRIKKVLEEKDLLSARKNQEIFYTTGDPQAFSKVASILLKYNVISQKVTPPEIYK